MQGGATSTSDAGVGGMIVIHFMFIFLPLFLITSCFGGHAVSDPPSQLRPICLAFSRFGNPDLVMYLTTPFNVMSHASLLRKLPPVMHITIFLLIHLLLVSLCGQRMTDSFFQLLFY